MSLQIYKEYKYNWQHASSELAIHVRIARIEGCWAGLRAVLHALRHYALRAKIILADFNSAVSTPTAKPLNLIPRQIFRLYGTHTADARFHCMFRCKVCHL